MTSVCNSFQAYNLSQKERFLMRHMPLISKVPAFSEATLAFSPVLSCASKSFDSGRGLPLGVQ